MDQLKQFISTLNAKMFGRSFGNHIKFDDLNGDCITLIFEKMDFEDLLKMAQVNQSMHHFAIDVFRRKFSKKKIVVYNYFVDEETEKDPGSLVKTLTRLGFTEKRAANSACIVSNDSIEIMTDLRMSLNLFKYFGSFIRNLKLVIANTESNDSKKLIQFVNKYCSELLVELELDVSEGNAFQYMEKPFKSVEHLFLRDFIPNIGTEARPMSQTFPALCALSLVPLRMIGNYIDCHLPYLEHLYLDVNYCDIIADLLTKNSQVRSIEVIPATSQYLQNLNAKLPNLQQLAVWDFEMTHKKIQFENVKKFIAKSSLNPPKNIQFPKLQELHINFGACHFKEWNNFLKNHNNLSHLQLMYWDLDDKKFESLTDNLSNLVEMTILRFKGNFIGIHSILRFLHKHERLLKFNLDDACEKETYEVIRERFEYKWEIRNFRKGLSLEQT